MVLDLAETCPMDVIAMYRFDSDRLL